MRREDWDAVWNVTQGRCWFCGVELIYGLKGTPPEQYTVDHLQPQRLGGTHDGANLVPACRQCNGMKGMKTLEEFRRYLERKSVGLEPLSPSQLAWLLDRGIDVEAMLRREAQEVIFWGERVAE